MSTTELKLKKCSACGSMAIIKYNNYGQYYYVKCSNCLKFGPYCATAATAKDAILRWNYYN